MTVKGTFNSKNKTYEQLIADARKGLEGLKIAGTIRSKKTLTQEIK